MCPYFASLNKLNHKKKLKEQNPAIYPQDKFPRVHISYAGAQLIREIHSLYNNTQDRYLSIGSFPHNHNRDLQAAARTHGHRATEPPPRWLFQFPSVLRSHKAGRKSPDGDRLSEKLLSKQISLSYGPSLALSRADIWTDLVVASVLLAVNGGPFRLFNHILALGFIGYTLAIDLLGIIQIKVH